MKTFDLSGVIHHQYDEHSRIQLIQPDGSVIDLVNRFGEVYWSVKSRQVQINYWISDEPRTKDQCVEALLRKAFGAIDAGYTEEHGQYSSWTSFDEYNTDLKVGGHDLAAELSGLDGKFLNLEIIAIE